MASAFDKALEVSLSKVLARTLSFGARCRAPLTLEKLTLSAGSIYRQDLGGR